MLLLRFDLEGRRYAIPGRAVEELLPLLPVEPFPQSPEVLIGLISWRSRPIPLLDLCQLLAKRPASQSMLSRIAVIKLDKQRTIGLCIENLSGTFCVNERELVDTSVRLAGAPYLGRVHGIGEAMIQLIEVERFADLQFDGILKPAVAQ